MIKKYSLELIKSIELIAQIAQDNAREVEVNDNSRRAKSAERRSTEITTLSRTVAGSTSSSTVNTLITITTTILIINIVISRSVKPYKMSNCVGGGRNADSCTAIKTKPRSPEN